MARCPSCGVDLAANPPVAGTAAHADHVDTARRRRAVMAVGVLVVAVAAGVVAVVAALGAPSSPGGASPPGPGSSAVAAIEAMPDPLAVPSRATGSVLVGVKGDRLVVIHLDRGTARLVGVPTAGAQSTISSVIADGDSVVVLQGGPQTNRPVWAYGPSALAGRAPPRQLGAGVTALPDANGRVWLVHAHEGQYSAESVGLDGTGRTSEIAVPGLVPIDVVSGGFLVESGGPTLAVWSPVSGAVVHGIGVGASPISLGALGRLVAWRETSCFCAVHLFDAQTGLDRSVPFGPGLLGVAGDQAAISPDGTSLALGLQRRDPPGVALGVVDVATGAAGDASTRRFAGRPGVVTRRAMALRVRRDQPQRGRSGWGVSAATRSVPAVGGRP